MEELNDDSVIDSINLNSSTSTHHHSNSREWKSGTSGSRHHANNTTNSNGGHYRKQNGSGSSGGAHNNSKKSKRLPWNCEVIRDRFTPQPYPIQIVERYLESLLANDIIILAQNQSLKQYLMLACIQLHQQKQVIKE